MIHYNLKPLEPQEALNELTDHFLGEDWYVVDPMSQTQINAIAVDDIKNKYPRPFKKRIYKKLSEYFRKKSKLWL